ncbi:MAG TPA: hypothetical protein VLJ39_18505, partial [Tepidisphaeraceae bacterium]|nr:hypothetical protein [Tepidisphaeraceae bacterium]
MTSSSPFTLQYDASPPPARRYSVVGAAIAWTAILVCLGVIGVTNWRAARSAARARAIDDYQLLMTSRVVIGEWQLFSQLPAAPPGLKDQLASQLQRIASDPVSKLRIASVIGELQGKNAALAALPQASALDQEPESQADLATMRTIYTAGPGAVTTTQRDELVRNEGWFGKLALSSGQPDSDPLRHETLRRAKRTFVASATTEIIVAIAALAGLVLLIITLIRLAGGRIHRSYRPAAFRSSAFVECFALYLSGYLLIGFAVRLLVPHATL